MKYRRYKGVRMLLLAAVTLALFSIAFIVLQWMKRSDYIKVLQTAYDQKQTEFQNVKEANEKMSYVANRDIRAGEVIEAADYSYESIYSSMDGTQFAAMNQATRVRALVDIKKGTQLLSCMLTTKEVTSAVREEEFFVFYLPESLMPEDVVDVRIFYPNGENYIVLSKKAVKGLSKESGNCVLWLDEEETLRISSAIVDAYQTVGTSLYLTKYIESGLQEASIVTYTPSEAIINLICTSPNILESAKQSLQKQVRLQMEKRQEIYKKQNGEEEMLEAFPSFVRSKRQMSNQMEMQNQTSSGEKSEEDEIIYVD